MEKINLLLEENEEIVWSYKTPNTEIIQGLSFPKYLTLIAIAFTVGIFVSFLILANLLNFEHAWQQNLFFFGFVSLEIIVPSLWIFITMGIYYSYKKKYMNKLGLNLKEFKEYEHIFILTNKNYIQKTVFVLDMKKNEKLMVDVKIREDLAFCSLEDIQMISIEKFRAKFMDH